jgi:hypothetical protein
MFNIIVELFCPALFAVRDFALFRVAASVVKLVNHLQVEVILIVFCLKFLLGS